MQRAAQNFTAQQIPVMARIGQVQMPDLIDFIGWRNSAVS